MQALLRVTAEQQEMYGCRDRSNPQGDRITRHTSVYDIEKAKLTVWSQKDYTIPYEFMLRQPLNKCWRHELSSLLKAGTAENIDDIRLTSMNGPEIRA